MKHAVIYIHGRGGNAQEANRYKNFFDDSFEITGVETMTNFANKINANLTIMRDGDHRFHTKEQMNFLDNRFQEHI